MQLFLLVCYLSNVVSTFFTNIHNSAGYMLGNLPLDKSSIVSKEHICEGTIYCV